jgi:hypothetical protein
MVKLILGMMDTSTLDISTPKSLAAQVPGLGIKTGARHHHPYLVGFIVVRLIPFFD